MIEEAGRVESIVHDARRIANGAERSRYLNQACAGDPFLRARVEELLAADVQPGNSGDALSTAETQAVPQRPRQPSNIAATPADSLSETAGSVIGRYRILRQIGEGGFGQVFLAEQEKPVRRRVALKIIKLGMDTRDVIARFEAERQALALMDHPHVAKVLDAGATDAGRPYFVMEYVEGIPITKYCDRHELPLRDRLELFIQACGAVQHAHQKGIIHRDIKPSNVLVAELDRKPVPKVIDFGIAKATQQKLTERTMYTEFGQFLGTPAYMSPEQAEMTGLDIDTRSDIYSLGVLLYELLTGTTPFDVKALRAAGITEIQRIIREEEPRKPSTRLTTLGDSLIEVAKLRRTDVRRIKTTLRGDLDWIVMKAMEKDRARRYDTATDFARDLRRYLDDEPVAAGPPTVSYRLNKFVRRNRTGVAISAVAAIALVGFAATMTVQAERIAAERDRANREREMSDRVVDFQANMLQDIKPLKLGESIAADLRNRLDAALATKGKADQDRQSALASFDAALSEINLTDSARNILDGNILAPAVKTVEVRFAEQPEVEARLQQALAATYRSLGLSEHALPHADRAFELRNEHLGPDHRETMRSLSLKAVILWDLARNEESGEILTKAVPKWEKYFGPEDPDVLTAKMCLGTLEMGRGRNAEARRQFDELLKVQERILGPDHVDVSTMLINLGTALLKLHRGQEAIPILERSLKIRQTQLEPDDPQTLSSKQALGKAYQDQGRMDESIQMQSEAIKSLERVRGARHPDTIEALSNLAELYKDQGRFQEAEPVARKALELQRATFGDAHRRTISAMTDLGIILAMLGRHAEAGAYHLQAYEQSKMSLGADHSDTMNKQNNLAVHYWYLGQYHRAMELFAEYLAGQERRYGKDHVETTDAMANLAIVYTRLGRLDESQVLLDKVLAIRTKAFGLDHRQTLATRASLAHLTYEKREWESAERLYVELAAAQNKTFGPDHAYTLESMYNLAIVTEKMGRKQDAAKLMADALAARRRVVGMNHSETLDTATELARMRFEVGETDEARALFAEVIAARRAAASAEGASPAQLDSCARVLLTCPAEDLRNPAEARGYAEQAAAATAYADAAYLNTLAKALFDTGQPAQAAETQRKAISLLPDQSPARADYEERLSEYAAADHS